MALSDFNQDEYLKEQENRTLFGRPIRDTTYYTWPDKSTFRDFIEDMIENYMSVEYEDERYPEEWIEFWLAYNEIEQCPDDDRERKNRDTAILNVVENEYNLKKAGF